MAGTALPYEDYLSAAVQAWAAPDKPVRAEPAPAAPARGARLIGTSGSDFMQGGAGNDTINSGAGRDVIYANGGHDLITASARQATIYGGAGNDTITGRVGDYFILGGSGDDYIRLTAFNTHEVFGDAGNDTIRTMGGIAAGGAGNDLLLGSAHTEILYAGTGTDTIRGYGGHDVLSGDGRDVLDGGVGNDRYFVTATSVRIIDAGGNDTISVGFDYALSNVSPIENLSGSARYLTLSGNDRANVMVSKGESVLFGHGGNDTFSLGTGDVAHGGAGHDVYILSHSSGALADIRESAGQGEDRVIFTGAISYALEEHIENIEATLGGYRSGRLSLTGNDLDNEISLVYSPILPRQSGIVSGGAGDDTISVEVRRSGATVEVYGETGADRFVIRDSYSPDRIEIMDFNAAEGDRIDFSALLPGRAFTLVTGGFTGAVGQLRIDAAGERILADLNGDRRADFALTVTGISQSDAGSLIL